MEGCNGSGTKCGSSESQKGSQLYRPTRERISDSSEENQDDQRHRQIVGLEEDKASSLTCLTGPLIISAVVIKF
ncbi:unnamed protein product [Anisakis simplex]|uniref:Uncharacterized protein n=2 Tax=Anisakis simplex TaxID=6269 RepID=A0A0M3IYV9_ANISI|nr:unnamed protein product [Anisakis simplex]